MQEQGKFYVTYFFLLSSSLQTSLKWLTVAMPLLETTTRDKKETRQDQIETSKRLQIHGKDGLTQSNKIARESQRQERKLDTRQREQERARDIYLNLILRCGQTAVSNKLHDIGDTVSSVLC